MICYRGAVSGLITLTRQLQTAFPAITGARICGHSDIAPGGARPILARHSTGRVTAGTRGRTMSFLVLLLAVWIEKFSALRHRIQRDGGWIRELNKLETGAPRLYEQTVADTDHSGVVAGGAAGSAAVGAGACGVWLAGIAGAGGHLCPRTR